MIKVLFLTPNLGGGGAEKVLVNLVNNMDKSKFDITVETIFDGMKFVKTVFITRIHFKFQDFYHFFNGGVFLF